MLLKKLKTIHINSNSGDIIPLSAIQTKIYQALKIFLHNATIMNCSWIQLCKYFIISDFMSKSVAAYQKNFSGHPIPTIKIRTNTSFSSYTLQQDVPPWIPFHVFRGKMSQLHFTHHQRMIFRQTTYPIWFDFIHARVPDMRYVI